MGSVESIAKHLIKLNNHKTNISFPAVVVNADRLEDGFVDVKPVVNYMNSVTGDTIEYPVIRGVRVVFPSSKSTTISFPLVQGDTVDLLFQSVDIEDFVNGNSSPHDPFSTGFGNLKNCVALVGFSPYQDSPFNPNNYKNEFNSQDLNIVHNKGTGLESSLNINTSGSILQKAPNAVTVDSPLFDVKSDLLNANNAVITTGGDVVVQGQSLNQFMLDAPLNLKGRDGDRGWSPVLAVENRGQEEAVLKLTDWVGGEGDKPSEQGYIGSNGLVSDILDAINIRGARGKSGAVLSADTIQEVVNNQLTTDRVLDLIQGQIDESALTDILTSKIADININKYAISQEIEDRVEAITETGRQIEEEAAARVEDIRLAAEAQLELQDFADRLADDIDTVVLSQTETDNGIAVIKERQTTFEIEQGVQAESLTYLSSQIDFGYADKTKYADKSKATAWTFAKTVAHADYTNSQMITGLSADYKDSSARFIENIELLSRQNEATATKTTTLSAQVIGDYEGGGLGKLNSGLIFEESKARATDVEGLAEQISLLSAGVGEQFDSYEIWHFNKDKDGWSGGTFSGGWIDVKTETLQSPSIEDLDGDVFKHVKIRIKKFGQPTWTGLLTHVGGSKNINEPSYDEEGVALANWQLEWTGDIPSFTLKLASVADAENYYSIDWIAVGRPSPGASNAALLRESKVRASETSANANDLVRLDSQINGGTGVPIESSITKQLETTANVANTTAEKVDVLTSTYNEDMYAYEGVVQTTARTLAEATKAEAERLDLLSADIKPRYVDKTQYASSTRSRQWTHAKTVAADNYASNQRITNLQSEFENSNANFTNELFTLATKDKSIAADITQLYAETGENYGLIQDISIAISKPEGGLAAQVTELQSRADAAEILLTDKGEIIFSYGAPPAKKEDKNNVWFKLKNEDNGIVSQTPHQWDGSKWVELKDSAALAAKADALAAKTAADNKGEVIYSATAPIAAKRLSQNLWIDTRLVGGKPANTPKRWNGSAWVAVTDKAVDDAQAAANAAAQAAGNKGEVIYSSNEPATDKRKVQNLWIDTSGGKNTPKRWSGSSWLTVTDKAATDAQKAADAANKKLEPENLSSLVEGSGAFSDEFGSISGQFANFEAVIDGQKTAMEVISGIGNAEKLKNEIAKARLDKDVTNLTEQSTALTNQINDYTTKIAELTTKRNTPKPKEMTQAKYNELRAEYAKQIADITAARADLTAQKAVIADQVAQLAAEKKVLDDFKEVEDGVRAQHTVKIDDDGKIVGFGLVLQDDGFSAFDVRADRFSISAPVGKPNDVNGDSPFMVLTNQQTIDGVRVEAGTYIRDFYAPRGSIDTLQVKDGAIKSAQIDDLAVTTAKIGEAQVDTLQIAGHAVTIPRIVEMPTGTNMSYSGSGARSYEIGRVTVDDVNEGSVSISFTADNVWLRTFSGVFITLTVSLYKEGLTDPLRRKVLRASVAGGGGRILTENTLTLPPAIDDPNGYAEYYIKATVHHDSASCEASLGMSAFTVMGNKR